MLSWIRGKLTPRQKATMTIMFADVCGSTQLFERYGDEKARKIVSFTLALLTQITMKYGGEVVKTIGDEIMCKYPDNSSAFQAACDMQRSIRNHEHLAKINMAIKIGFHHGEILLEKNDVFGDAVNVAARMVGMAKAKQIICTGSTIAKLPIALAKNARNLGRVKVRGKKREMEIFEVIWQEDTSDVTMLYKSTDPPRRPASVRLVLHHKGQRFEVNEKLPFLSLGRDRENDLSVDTDLASRNHASIEFRQGKFLLTDRSTNGTFVWMENGEKFFIHREDIHLYNRGIISLGRDAMTDDPDLIYYKYVSKKESR